MTGDHEPLSGWALETLGLTQEDVDRAEGLDDLRYWLRLVFRDNEDAARAWLRTQLPALGDQTPVHAIRAGDPELVAVFLIDYHVGVFL